MGWFYKWLSSFLAALILTTAWPWILRGEEATYTVAGRVLDSRREAVDGVKIIANGVSGKIALEAVSNAEGFYCLENLAPDRYHFTLEPTKASYQGNTVVASVGNHLIVDWFVAADAKAIGTASLGQSTCAPLSRTQKGIVGGILATGWLGTLIIPFVASPSR